MFAHDVEYGVLGGEADQLKAEALVDGLETRELPGEKNILRDAGAGRKTQLEETVALTKSAGERRQQGGGVEREVHGVSCREVNACGEPRMRRGNDNVRL